jgi:hypothetical protein
VTKDLGLAGVYFETDAETGFAVDEVVMTSVAVPELQRRAFPFTRLAGRGRIVRVQELPGGEKRIGIALEFGDDVTALTALPTRG